MSAPARALVAVAVRSLAALARNAVVLAAVLAAACGTMHGDKSAQTSQARVSPATITEGSDGSMAGAAPGGATDTEHQVAAAPDTTTKPPAVPTPASATTPPCSCMAAAKPKHRRKPAPVVKVAPPQLPTAATVIATPPGGVVDAQVRSMSVSVTSILGRRVRGPAGEDMGRVVDVLADSTGRVRAAIIDFGGFLGVGNHRIAVDWPLLRFNTEAVDEPIELSVSREKLQTAPEYKPVPRPQSLAEPPVPATPPTTPPAAGKT